MSCDAGCETGTIHDFQYLFDDGRSHFNFIGMPVVQMKMPVVSQDQIYKNQYIQAMYIISLKTQEMLSYDQQGDKHNSRICWIWIKQFIYFLEHHNPWFLQMHGMSKKKKKK